jgi:hypothetical protein
MSVKEQKEGKEEEEVFGIHRALHPAQDDHSLRSLIIVMVAQ